jgi:hypothetical protein
MMCKRGIGCCWRGARCAHGAGKGREGGTEEKSELQPVESHKAFIFMTLFSVSRRPFFSFFSGIFLVVVLLLFPSGTSRQLGHAWDTLHATRYPTSFYNLILFGRHLFF